VSLQTKDRREALARLDAARVEINQFFRAQALRASKPSGIVPTYVRPERPQDPALPLLQVNEVEGLARAFFVRVRAEIEHRTAEELEYTTDEVATLLRELEDRQRRLFDLSDPYVEHPALSAEIDILRRAGRRSSYESDASVLLRSYLVRAMRQTGAIEIARLKGDFHDVVSDGFFAGRLDASPIQNKDAKPRSGVGKTLDNIVDAWASEGSVTPKSVDASRAVARWFVERVGPIAVEAISPRDVRLFKKKLVGEGVSPPNINTKLARLRALLEFAVDDGDLSANPAKGIGVRDRDAAHRQRQEFDLVSLNAIFGSPVYSRAERPIRGRGEAAYWLPLMALYTGARLEELAQLRPIDVARETYMDGDDVEQTAWVIRIVRDDEDGLKLKNAVSERRVPIHADLEQLGFIKFAQAALAAEQGRLFPLLKADHYGRFGSKWGEWWSVYRRDVCAITDRRMVFHSFRHTFKCHARNVGMLEGVQRQIMGHSPKDAADSYGASGYSLYRLVEGMRLYRVPGLKLRTAVRAMVWETVRSVFRALR
jgi:integrase